MSAVLSQLGMDMGREEHLSRASSENPRGFWENQEIKNVNERLLQALGGNWDDPPRLREGWEQLDVLNRLRQQAATVLSEEFGESAVAGWKDPRNSLTLPFWQTIRPVPKTILCARSPHEVAGSLALRNGFTTEKTAHLWLRYVVSAWLNHHDPLIVRYNDFFLDTDETVRRIGEHAGLDAPSASTLDWVRDFFEPSLNRNKEAGISAGPLMDLAEGALAVLEWEDQDLAGEVFASLGLLMGVGAPEDGRVAVEDEETAGRVVREQLGTAPQTIALIKRRKSGEARREEFARHVALCEARAQIGELRDKLSETTSDVRSKSEKVRELHREVEDLRQELDDVRSDADTARQEAESAAAELKRAQAARDALSKEKASVERQHARLGNRRSVRIALKVAEPWRPVFKLVRRRRGRRGSSEGRSIDQQGVSQPQVRSVMRARHDPDERRWIHAADALSELWPVTVVIPVHNAPSELKRCIDALVRNTTVHAELLLIDDASTDPQATSVLEEASRLEGVSVLRNRQNLGFVATANRGFSETAGDVVLLNSDAEVTPDWLEKLAIAAYHRPDVGTVTPLSDNAGAFSAPEVGDKNSVPAWLDFDDIGRLVSRCSGRLYPRTPTGNGFCLYIKRAMLDEVGYFHQAHFPRGYGEENDLCMRAREAGWDHVVEDSTYVFHQVGASFGSERAELSRSGRAVVDQLHPDYTRLVRGFVGSNEMGQARGNVRSAFEANEDTCVPRRVLFVVHRGQGGTPSTNLDLMEALGPTHECLVLESDTRTLTLSQAVGRELLELERRELREPLRFGQMRREDYRSFVASVIMRYAVELVHVRHLVKHTLDVPSLARSFGIPLIVSLHDYYLACPTFHLLDEQDQFCGGECTPGEGPCRIPMDWVAQDAPPLKHDWVYRWRENIFPILCGADALVTTTESAKDVYLNTYPELRSQRFEVIEHGRQVGRGEAATQVPEPGGMVRLLVPGNLDVHKGSRFLAIMKDHDKAERLELHFLGNVSEEVRQLGVDHGRYTREEFASKVSEVQPAFIGLFSVTAETYMHSLTEAWASGVPVVGTDIGAIGERVRQRGGGWLVPVDDPRGAYEKIMEIADNPEEYRRGWRRVSVDELPSSGEMADAYAELYESVLRRRKSLGSGGGAAGWGKRETRAEMLVVGSDGDHPGSAHVRSLRPMFHPGVRASVAASLTTIEAFREDETETADVLYIQRTAVPPALTEAVIQRGQQTGTPIVVDLDDNLLEARELPKGASGPWRRYVQPLRRLVEAAALVTVSTDALEEVVRRFTPHVAVLPNALDEGLWFTGEFEAGYEPRRTGPAGLQLVYVGTRTHSRDLAVLRPIMERIREEVDPRAVLHVVGGEEPGRDQEWYRRVSIPSSCKNYPQFVRWLRSEAHQWDIALAPLEASAFNRYKSDLKFLEYSALKLPGVFSRVRAYEESIAHEKTGMLADEDPDSWVEAIRALWEDVELRGRIARRAGSEVLGNRVLRVVGREYARTLSRVAEGESVNRATERSGG